MASGHYGYRESTKSMKRIKIIVWNARNLTRQWRIGGWDGLSRNERVKRVSLSVTEEFYPKNQKKTDGIVPGLLLLLETGEDAGDYLLEIGQRLKDGSSGQDSWTCKITDATGGTQPKSGSKSTQSETYTAFFNTRVYPQGKLELLGREDNGTRRGCLARNQLNFILGAIHAPSARHQLQERTRTIVAFARALSSEFGVRRAVLCGDFNMKEGKELNGLKQALGSPDIGQFILKGPLDTTDSKEPSLSTSLRQINTILQLSGSVRAESEPYDMVWEQSSPADAIDQGNARVHNVKLLKPVVTKSSRDTTHQGAVSWAIDEVSPALKNIKDTLTRFKETELNGSGEDAVGRNSENSEENWEDERVPEEWEEEEWEEELDNEGKVFAYAFGTKTSTEELHKLFPNWEKRHSKHTNDITQLLDESQKVKEINNTIVELYINICKVRQSAPWKTHVENTRKQGKKTVMRLIAHNLTRCMALMHNAVFWPKYIEKLNENKPVVDGDSSSTADVGTSTGHSRKSSNPSSMIRRSSAHTPEGSKRNILEESLSTRLFISDHYGVVFELHDDDDDDDGKGKGKGKGKIKVGTSGSDYGPSTSGSNSTAQAFHPPNRATSMPRLVNSNLAIRPKSKE